MSKLSTFLISFKNASFHLLNLCQAFRFSWKKPTSSLCILVSLQLLAPRVARGVGRFFLSFAKQKKRLPWFVVCFYSSSIHPCSFSEAKNSSSSASVKFKSFIVVALLSMRSVKLCLMSRMCINIEQNFSNQLQQLFLLLRLTSLPLHRALAREL